GYLPAEAAPALPPRPAARPQRGRRGRGRPGRSDQREDGETPAPETLPECGRMNASQHQPGSALALSLVLGASRSAASQLASQLRARWDRGETADVLAALAEYPELAAEKAVALDLAYEEYCRRREAGEDVDPDSFCARFPSLRVSLRKQLEAHAFLEGRPDL